MACVFFLFATDLQSHYPFWHYRQSTALWNNIFLFQVIFGALTISVRCLALYPLNNVGRRPTEIFSCSWWDFPFWSTCLCLKVRRLEFGERKCLSNHHGLCWVILSGASSKEWSQLRERKKKNKTKLTTLHLRAFWGRSDSILSMEHISPSAVPYQRLWPQTLGLKLLPSQRQPTLCLWSRWWFSC